MGGCTSANSGGQVLKSYYQQPQDIAQYDSAQKNTMTYQGNISKIRIENANSASLKNVSISFRIPQIVETICSSKQVQNTTIKWEQNVGFTFQSNEYGIRSKFLHIEIRSKGEKILYSLKINLYKIMTGPIHHDFKISKDGKSGGRIIFDLKISQIISLQINTLNTTISFTKEYPGERFSFQIQSHSLESNKKQTVKSIRKSLLSEVKEIPLNQENKFRPVTQFDEAPSPTTRIKRKGTKIVKIDNRSELNWGNYGNKKLPSILLRIKVDDLFSSTLMCKLFRLTNHHKKIEFCSWNLMISEILNKSEPHVNNPKSNTNKENIVKNLYKNGKVLGTSTMYLQITYNKFIKQILNSSRTEDGIINMHHFERYHTSPRKGKYQDNENKQLIGFYSKLLLLIQSESQDMDEGKYSYQTLHKYLQELNQQLTKSLKGSLVYYSVDKSWKILSKQNLSINILNLMAKIIQNVLDSAELRELCWKIAVAILMRGQMILRNLSVTSVDCNDSPDEKHKNIMKNKQQKQKTAENYCEAIFSLLKLSFDTQIAGNNGVENSEIFKAFCFVRVPIYQKKIIDIISSQNFCLPEGLIREIQCYAKYLQIDLNWQKYFFDPLKDSSKIAQLQADMKNNMENEEWFQKLAKKRDFFYDFIRCLMAKLGIIRDKHKLETWGGLPGYRIIVESALCQLSKQSLSQWSYKAILMSISLLQNQQLLHYLLTVLFEKTNLYNGVQTRLSMSILSQYMHQIISTKIHKKGCLSLFIFPYEYFTNCIKQIMELSIDHLTLRLMLIFIFKFYNFFDRNFRYQLSKYLLGKMFWKLFYFWSYEVRDVFYHIMILKISQDIEVISCEDFPERLKLCVRIIENSHLVNQLQLKSDFSEKFPFHQKMKTKLKQKKKKNKIKLMTSPSFNSLQLNFESLVNYKNTDKTLSIGKYLSLYQEKDKDQSETKIQFLPTQDNINPIFHIQRQYSQSSQGNTGRMVSLNRNTSITSFMVDNHNVELGFIEKQLQLPHLSQRQLLQISSYFRECTLRFKQVAHLVHGYYEQHKQLPKMEQKLQALGVQIDRKDIMPEQFYFDVFD